MSRAQNGSGDLSAAQKLRSHLDYLAELPHPPETFFATDEPLENDATRRTLQESGIIRIVNRLTQYEGETEYCRNEYQVAEWAARRVEEIRRNRDTFCPCGHGGFRNCGDHFECGFEGCDREFDRDELEVDA